MAHFAKLENNVVTEIIVVANEILIDENGMENENLGIAFCNELFGGEWKQTSYNGTFRGEFAGIGMIYDEINDIFKYPELNFTESLIE